MQVARKGSVRRSQQLQEIAHITAARKWEACLLCPHQVQAIWHALHADELARMSAATQVRWEVLTVVGLCPGAHTAGVEERQRLYLSAHSLFWGKAITLDVEHQMTTHTPCTGVGCLMKSLCLHRIWQPSLGFQTYACHQSHQIFLVKANSPKLLPGRRRSRQRRNSKWQQPRMILIMEAHPLIGYLLYLVETLEMMPAAFQGCSR